MGNKEGFYVALNENGGQLNEIDLKTGEVFAPRNYGIL
ncbi:MAG: hypothetical protein ACJASQ_002007 [Crocinitomicaceae bacterium]|jgi:hypothetical protein